MQEQENDEFTVGDYVVYPAHGVGQISEIREHKLSGDQLEMISIAFNHDRMVVHVPSVKAQNAGLRKLSSEKQLESVFQILKMRSRIRRAMWSRRAQEYETKINSGNPIYLAEVVRDLYRPGEQYTQSYSERQLYRMALERLAREVAAIETINTDSATEKLELILQEAA